MPNYKYVGWEEVRVYTTKTGNKRAMDLLWGDRVEVLEESGARAKIRARGRNRIG